ncbi:MAG: DUF4870 domain-containing protein [Candidatus Sumerlaeia bacterium]
MARIEEEIPALPPMHTDERGLAVLSHISTMVPIWALVVNAILYFQCRERSRAVCFHARQGINFQLLFLLVVIPLFFIYFLSSLAEIVMRPLVGMHAAVRLGLLIDQLASLCLVGVFLAYITCCLIGIIQALRGIIFVYPIAGKKVFRRHLDEVVQGE